MNGFVRPLALTAVLLAGSAVQAQPRGQASTQQDSAQTKVEPAPRNSRPSSLPATVRRVERETGGEVISAEPVRRDGREVYNLKVLTPNGRVKVVQDDPNPRREQAEREPSPRDRGSQGRDSRPRETGQPRRQEADDDGGNDSQL
jgi:hypothetical protein